MKGIYISAIKRSSGKTTLSIAITRLLVEKGFKVITFKKGPDFIDPMWLTAASKRLCFNLDFFFHNNIKEYFYRKTENSDFIIVESNHGLFDDIGVNGKRSNASLAKLLDLPVILVVDVSEFGRSIIPVIQGVINFDIELKFSGIILNRVKSKRHETRLINNIKKYINLQVIGSVPEDPKITIEQRHLGLSSCLTNDEMNKKIELLSNRIKPFVDINKIILSANKIKKFYTLKEGEKLQYREIAYKKKVGICFDRAFNFYYPENLDNIVNSGGELIYLSPLNDYDIPEIDCLYIGGGFPENFANILEKNYKFKEKLRYLIEKGMPLYAECGGLIYLTDELIIGDKKYKMLGVIKARAIFQKKPVAHGYSLLKKISNKINNLPIISKGHEFHHFYLDDFEEDYDYLYRVVRGKGVKDGLDGLIYKNVIANFTHIYDCSKYGSFFEHWLNFDFNLLKSF